MNERFNFLVLYFAVGCLFTLVVINKNKSHQDYEDSNMKQALEKAFKEGFFNGKNSYIAQINDVPYEYASFTAKYDNLSEVQKNKLEKETQRGYVEGYHKAAMEHDCPIERN